MAAGEEAVVGVEGGVKEIEAVELLKKDGVKQERGCLRIARMSGMEALEALDGARVIEVIKVIGGFANQGVAIERVGMHVRSAGKGGGCQQGNSQ
jgi:hypothetical protein